MIEADLVVETRCQWFTPQRLRQMLLTVDGTGSGLDADLLDGVDSTGYLLVTGARTGATSQAQTFTNGIASASVRPISDGTQSIKLFKADGTTQFAAFDTTNKRFGIGSFTAFSPSATVDIREQTNAVSAISITHSVNADVITVSKTSGLGNLATVSFTSAQASGLVFTNTDASTYLANSFMYGHRAVISAGVDNFGIIAGSYSATNTRTASGSNPDLSIAVDATASSSIATAGTWGYGVRSTGSTGNIIPIYAKSNSTATTSIQNAILLGHNTSGTPAANYGIAIAAQLESSTTVDRDAGRLSWQWATATDASRAAKGKLTAYYTTTERECIAWEASSTGAKFSVLGATPAAQQVGLATAAGATYGAIEQTMLQTAYDCLRTFGFLG